VFPAHAGLNRPFRNRKRPRQRVPRTCGAEPVSSKLRRAQRGLLLWYAHDRPRRRDDQSLQRESLYRRLSGNAFQLPAALRRCKRCLLSKHLRDLAVPAKVGLNRLFWVFGRTFPAFAGLTLTSSRKFHPFRFDNCSATSHFASSDVFQIISLCWDL
jgi:hypothetical protein